MYNKIQYTIIIVLTDISYINHITDIKWHGKMSTFTDSVSSQWHFMLTAIKPGYKLL